jgi:hypothetical protein
MTFSAILAYGYDLQEAPRFSGGADPAWWNPEQDVYQNLSARLTAEADPAGPGCDIDHSNELDDTVGGVVLTAYGSEGGPRHLLAARGFFASDWEAAIVPGMDVPDCAERHLAWAVRVLELDVTGTAPAWRLAAEYF